MQVPFFRPELDDAEIAEVVETLRSGWLTTGPKTQRFETAFANAVGARHAVALASCTAGLHLSTLGLGLRAGQAVLVPTMTFAATAEVIRYAGAVPILVDCTPTTLQMDLRDAERKIADARAGRLPIDLPRDAEIVGMLPVHVGGRVLSFDAVAEFARRHRLWRIEDAAHAFPAAWRPHAEAPWRRCGEDSAEATCFSFYANKTITTGEGGMVTTADEELAERMRSLSLHGLSKDAWGRYTAKGAWDYRIVAPGYKYNLTDIASALGLHQLAKAEALRRRREEIAERFRRELADVEEIELPPTADGADDPALAEPLRDDPEAASQDAVPPTAAERIHAWHLFQIRLRADSLAIDRDRFLEELRAHGVGFSVHWRPLHLHPYWSEAFGWRPQDLPVATDVWRQTVTLPLFPAMREEEIEHVIATVRELCRRNARPTAGRAIASARSEA
ncbi:MAG: DegT/DnrJ/EryC1/StrS family aminotransferase [Acidobacteriota bacterium]